MHVRSRMRSTVSAEDAVQQDGENDERHDDVESIALQSEGDDRERHPRHGSGKEQHEPELDQAAAARLEAIAYDAIDAAQVCRLTAEDAIVRRLATVAEQVEDGSR